MKDKVNFSAPAGWRCDQRRKKIYVDLENGSGGSSAVCANQEFIRQLVLRLREQYSAQVTFSVGPTALSSCPNLIWDWSFARFIPGRGLDGADLALLGAIQNEPFHETTDSLILISGDLELMGIPTTVISHRHALSNQLKKVASNIQYLPEFQTLLVPRRTA